MNEEIEFENTSQLKPEDILRLPLMDLGTYDWDKFSLKDGLLFERATGKLCARTELYKEKAEPKPVTWQELSSISFPEQEWCIQNILPAEGFTVLAAASGEKKTWIALEMARCLITGEDFLAYEGFKTKPCNVLYIDCEMPKSILQKRCKLLSYDLEALYKVWFLSSDDLNLNQEQGIAWLFKFIEENKIGAVFIDTLRGVAGGMKEEKAEEVRIFFNRFKPLKNQGVSVVFIDHCRKPQRQEGRTPKKEQLFASQDKVASVEILLMLKSDVGSKEVGVYQNKNRLSREIKPFKVLVEDEKQDDVTTKVKLTYAGEFEEQELKNQEAKDLIIDLLRESGKTTPELIEIGKQSDIGKRNMEQAVRELRAENLIIMPGKKSRKNYYILADSNLDSREENNDLSLQETKALEETGFI